MAAQTVRFKNELERNITIKLGYANAKIYQCKDPDCPRPGNFLTRGSSTDDITWSGWMPMNWSFQRLPAAANGYVTSKWALRVHWNGDALRSVLKVVHMHCEEEGFVEDWRGARLHVRLQMQTLVPPLPLKLEDGQANDDEEWFNVEAVDHASISIPVLWTGHQYAICRGAGVLRC